MTLISCDETEMPFEQGLKAKDAPMDKLVREL